MSIQTINALARNGWNDMDGSRSREALAEFLDYLANKGLMARATAQARKAAASNILGILEPNEAADVTTLDVEDVVARFQRLHGTRYAPQSLTTYKSRLRSAIEDFTSYLANPLGFRPAGAVRERPKVKSEKESIKPKAAVGPEARLEGPRAVPPPLAGSNIVPIAIRADVTIYIQGLPFDLTEGEARKIAAVVTAMAQP